MFVVAPRADDDPHPDLVLAQRPAAAQIMQAAGILGMFPDGSYLSGEISVSLPLTGTAG